jgi:hypothetical protein
MTISAAYFQNEIALAAKTSNNHNYANTKSELTLLATALGTDPTTYDTTIQAAPGILNPSLSTNTYWIDRVDLIINKGKAGGLTPATMATAINAVVATLP